MKQRKPRWTHWITRIGCAAGTLMLATGCFGFGKDTENTDYADTEPSFGNFCHGLTFDGGDIEIQAAFEKDDKKTTLTAVTGTCSTSLDAGCEEIPMGDDVKVSITAGHNPILVTTLQISPDNEYGFYLNIDKNFLPVLYTDDLTESSLSCSASECTAMIYTPSTCAPGDPCGWVNDGHCDDLCTDIAAPMFDDSADCAGSSK